MIKYRWFFFRFCEFFCFSNSKPLTTKCDFVRKVSCIKGECESHNAKSYNTIRKDLLLDDDLMMSEMSQSTRNLVRRGIDNKRLNIDYSTSYTKTLLFNDFLTFYNEYSNDRAIGSRGMKRIHSLLEGDRLFISRVKIDGDISVAYHVLALGEEGALLLYSVSNFLWVKNKIDNQAMQQANRLLHWQDFLLLKAHGFSFFDWGGVYLIDDNSKKSNIAKFKKGFGGDIYNVVNTVEPISVLGNFLMPILKHFNI